MNPSAQAFVPKKKGQESNATKLSAAAPPFVPPKKSTPGKGPAQASANAPDTPPTAQQHADPEQPVSQPPPKDSTSTATEPKVDPVAPAVPATDNSESGNATATQDSEGAAQGNGLAPLSHPLSATDLLEKQIEELPPAEPLDWSTSKLPELFGCHNTKAKATTEPIRLNTPWALYADDHGTVGTPVAPPAGSPTGGGGAGNPTSFDPVLVATINDVESLWRLWRYLPPPSRCPVPFTYSWFRDDVKPEWEHPRNKRGGIITVVVFDRDKVGLNDAKVMDDVWMATIVGCAGESFVESATMLNGVMLKVRANNRPVTMQLWFANSDPSKLRAFASSFREAISRIMGAKWLQKLEFYSHNQKQLANNTLASRMKVKSKATPDFVF